MDKPDELGKSRDNHKKKEAKKLELENANENFKCLRSVGKMFFYQGAANVVEIFGATNWTCAHQLSVVLIFLQRKVCKELSQLAKHLIEIYIKLNL